MKWLKVSLDNSVSWLLARSQLFSVRAVRRWIPFIDHVGGLLSMVVQEGGGGSRRGGRGGGGAWKRQKDSRQESTASSYPCAMFPLVMGCSQVRKFCGCGGGREGGRGGEPDEWGGVQPPSILCLPACTT